MRVNSVLDLFIFCGFFTLCLATVAPKTKSGLYTIKLLKAKKCEKPSSPYLKDPIFSAVIEQNVKNKNIIRGNFTVIQNTSNIKMNVQDFYSEAGKWQITFNMKNLSCRSHFVSDLLKFIYIVYDKKTCAVSKGTYELEADLDTLDHMWSPTREYGRMLRRVEAVNRAGTAFCLEVEADVKPAA